MKNLKRYLLGVVVFFSLIGGANACEQKLLNNQISFKTSAMSVLEGYLDLEFTCPKGQPYRLYPKDDQQFIRNNNEDLTVSYWLNSNFTTPISSKNPFVDFGTGQTTKMRLFVKITGKGPNLNGLGNIVINKHNLNIRNNVVLE